MPNNFSHSTLQLSSLTIMFLMAFLLWSVNTNTSFAQEVLEKRKPVPTYGDVVSYNNTTQATIPVEMKSKWAGSYQIKTSSLIAFPEYEPSGLIKQIYYNIQQGWSKQQTFSHDPSAVYNWTKQIAQSVDAEAKEPRLVINNGRATEFTPPQVGKKLDRYHSTIQILEALEKDQTTVDLTVLTTQPAKPLAELNDLGITELIGRGESNFAGSPANRRHNIRVGVEKMKGIIVKPGDEFSFNHYLGPVEASEGFVPELVIKGNDTIPELGGGLCQVSSTTFRAVMHAGLPVTQRKNHSYAVQYYAPQGTDATIYPGVIDLKFRNDTGHSILIWPYLKDNNHLVFDFYGTDDGREVKLNNPVVYDRQSNGAMKATWTRTVIKNGQESTDRFASVYRPPAEFHRSENFVSNNNKPQTPPESTKPDSNIEFFVGDKPET